MSEDVNWKEIKKIFILNFISNTIGDSLYLLPFIQRIKKECPQAEIFVTGSSITKELIGTDTSIKKFIELKNIEQIDKKIPKYKKIKLVLSILNQCIKELRNEKPEVCFIGIPNFSIYQLTAPIAGVKYKFGFSYPNSHFSFLLNKTVPFKNPGTSGDLDLHFAQPYFDLLENLGMKIEKEDKFLKKSLTNNEVASAKKILNSNKKTLIAIQAGARYPFKTWPSERFSKVGKFLRDKYNAKILLLGSKSEFDYCKKIKSYIGKDCLNLCGNLSLGASAAVLKQCKFILGNDSGLVHLAASVGTQPIIISGSSHPIELDPPGIKKAIIIVSKNWKKEDVLDLFDDRVNKNEQSKRLLETKTEDVMKVCDFILSNKDPKKEDTYLSITIY